MKEIEQTEQTDKIELIPISSIEINIQDEILDSAFIKKTNPKDIDIDNLLRRFSYIKCVWEVK